MTNEVDAFIREGMLRYREATEVYYGFRTEVQNRLQAILKLRKNWGPFRSDLKSVRSTGYGQNYPLLNAKIDCDPNDENFIIVIAVNWYESETSYPFYAIWIEGSNNLAIKSGQNSENARFEYRENAIRFIPDPEDFNMERDFNGLLDEFTQHFSDRT